MFENSLNIQKHKLIKYRQCFSDDFIIYKQDGVLHFLIILILLVLMMGHPNIINKYPYTTLHDLY